MHVRIETEAENERLLAVIEPMMSRWLTLEEEKLLFRVSPELFI